MATCPECRAGFGDDVQTCPQHGCALVPDELVLPSDVPLAAGTMVGEYRIEHKLGAGTFGDVYAGEQPVIGKRVAVKVLNRRFASDPVMVSRFVAEARAVNKIRQRNIIDIFSFGVLPGLDRHYFVMELLDGLTLGALLDRTGRLPVALVLPIVRGIADALDAVHEAGITHRDLKPDNVFLARERDGTYFPKLLDFGIAKLIGDDVAHKTGSGMVLGTPRYMSPEQARGKPADHRADIYALGVMIHEMLTGTPLFVGDSAVDMLLKQAVDDPPRLSEACPDLAPALDAPVLAMLQKRPQDRPASAGEAVAALAACARKLGLDHAAVSLAELAANDAPARREAPAAGTTMTLQRPGRDGAATPRRADPMGKTERAPASNPEAKSTLRSKPVSGPAEDTGTTGRSEPTTESVSTLETSSEIKRLARARRWKVAAGSAAALAVGCSIWALGRTPQASHSTAANGREAVTSAPLSTAPSAPHSAPPSANDAEPTVRPATNQPEAVQVRLSTRPADVDVWLGDRKLGSSAGPVPLPRGSARVELRLKKQGFNDEVVGLTPDRDQALDATLSPTSSHREPGAAAKPGTSARRMDRILGDRE